MANYIEFEGLEEGVREIMTSGEMMALCTAKANKMLSSLGHGYEITTHVGRNRVNAEVATASREARQENLKNNSILKALGAAR